MEEPALFRYLQALADPVRCRVLRIAARQELTVTELASVLQLPQSTLSRHLKTLLDAGLLQSRREGTSRLYRPSGESEDVSALWAVVADQLNRAEPAETGADDRRLENVLQARRSHSRDFFSTAAGEWDRLRGQLYGSSFHLSALPALLDRRLVVADLGCGAGAVTESLAPYVQQVYAVDGSSEMLQAARQRLASFTNVETMQGELEAVPLPDQAVDAALLVLVLHYLPDPGTVIREAARLLKPDGKLLIIDMVLHRDSEMQQQMGHQWPGFEERELRRWMERAGLRPAGHWLLPVDAEARGPRLFAAVAGR